jgi:hypothetical protein
MDSSVSDIVSPSRQAQLGVSDQDQIHRYSDSPDEHSETGDRDEDEADDS